MTDEWADYSLVFRCADHPDRLAAAAGLCMDCLIGEVGGDEARAIVRRERERYERNRAPRR